MHILQLRREERYRDYLDALQLQENDDGAYFVDERRQIGVSKADAILQINSVVEQMIPGQLRSRRIVLILLVAGQLILVVVGINIHDHLSKDLLVAAGIFVGLAIAVRLIAAGFSNAFRSVR